jgi:non-homologous end joining protein Ku
VQPGRYEEALRAVLAKKHEVEVVEEERGGGKEATPVNLMDALRRSLASVPGEKKRPARTAVARPRVLNYAASRRRRRAS